MLNIYDLRYPIYESSSYPVGVLDLKDSAVMQLEPSDVGSYNGKCLQTREIVKYRDISGNIVNPSCLVSCYFSKESCIIVLSRVKNKESFFRPLRISPKAIKGSHPMMRYVDTAAHAV